jgi:crotonobetainyl-CoA:carnitine CoA-transferase CaiB-like acyl-CoA transferase
VANPMGHKGPPLLATAVTSATPPPALGADTEDVLAEIGYGATEIAALRRDKGDLTAGAAAG